LASFIVKPYHHAGLDMAYWLRSILIVTTLTLATKVQRHVLAGRSERIGLKQASMPRATAPNK
jgi:hypothetical protein